MYAWPQVHGVTAAANANWTKRYGADLYGGACAGG